MLRKVLLRPGLSWWLASSMDLSIYLVCGFKTDLGIVVHEDVSLTPEGRYRVIASLDCFVGVWRGCLRGVNSFYCSPELFAIGCVVYSAKIGVPFIGLLFVYRS